MAIKALVLDLDSTLYEHEKEHRADLVSLKKMHEYLKKKGLFSKVPKEELKVYDLMMSTGMVVTASRTITKKYGLELAPFEEYIYNLHPKSFGIKRDPRLVSQLSELSRLYKIAILSNGHRIWVNRAIRVLGLDSIISKKNRVMLTSLKGSMKPEPEAYRILLNTIKLKANEVIFLDDRARNINGARRLGIKSIKIDNSNPKGRNSIYSVLDRLRYNTKLR